MSRRVTIPYEELEPYNTADNSPKEFDPVERPEHYAKGKVECIDWIEESLTEEEFKGYLKGNVLKYLWRYKDKGNPPQDLKKARWYIDKLGASL